MSEPQKGNETFTFNRHAMGRRQSKQAAFIQKKVGQAIGKYDMIREGDRILIGVSGGKDSLALLKVLQHRQSWSPVKYHLIAAHIHSNLLNKDTIAAYLEELFPEMGVEGYVRRIRVPKNKRKSNCFWCAWNRRKALFDLAEELTCNKLALAHHKDDIIETTLLNMFYGGCFSTMNPSQQLFEGRLTIIRPLVYCEEKMIAKLCKEYSFRVIDEDCDYRDNKNRELIKKMIANFQKKNPKIRDNIFRSMANIKEEYVDIRVM